MKRKLTRFVIIAIAAVMLLAGCTTAMAEANMYQGTMKGFSSTVTVDITVNTDGKIETVKIDASGETEAVGGAAAAELEKQILAANSAEIDGVTGATITSQAVIGALTQALKEAGADTLALRNVPVEISYEQPEDQNAQVVVVGAGMSGLFAAVSAADKGADVLLLEKLPYVGGSVVYAMGAYQSANSKVLEEQGILNSVEGALAGIHAVQDVSARQPDYELVEYMLYQAGDMMDYMINDLEVSYSVVAAGTDSSPAAVLTGGAEMGIGLIKQLCKKMEENGVRVMTDANVTEILMEDGRPVGVKVMSKGGSFNVKADQIILATGGSGLERLIESNPILKTTGMDNQAGAGDTGDGFAMLEEIGAKFADGLYTKTAAASFPASLDVD